VLGLALLLTGSALLADEAGSGGPANPVPNRAPEPFVVEPAVRLEAAGPTRQPRATAPRPHPGRGVPLSLRLPRLGVTAPVLPIEARRRVLRPPDDPTTLGWWRDGARPGDPAGAALVAGHTVSTGGGALDDLERTRRGDLLHVRTTRGRIRYRVVGVSVHRKATLARHAARIFSQEGPGRLVLLTCEDWDGRRYLSNVVVVAQPVVPRSDRRGG
jgi:hypothetical protein